MHEVKTFSAVKIHHLPNAFPQNDPFTEIPPIIMRQDEFMHRSSLKTETLQDVTSVVARSQCEFCAAQT